MQAYKGVLLAIHFALLHCRTRLQSVTDQEASFLHALSLVR